jgi:hypothetical protein
VFCMVQDARPWSFQLQAQVKTEACTLVQAFSKENL